MSIEFKSKETITGKKLKRKRIKDESKKGKRYKKDVRKYTLMHLREMEQKNTSGRIRSGETMKKV